MRSTKSLKYGINALETRTLGIVNGDVTQALLLQLGACPLRFQHTWQLRCHIVDFHHWRRGHSEVVQVVNIGQLRIKWSIGILGHEGLS